MFATQLGWIFWGFAYTFFGHWVIGYESIYESFLATGRHTFFMENKNVSMPTFSNSLLPDLVLSDLIIVCVQGAIILAWQIQDFFIFGLLGTCCVTIWSAVQQFVDLMRNIPSNDRSKFSQLRQKFHELNNLSQKINSIWAVLCFWTTIEFAVDLWTKADMIRTLDGFYFIKCCTTYVCSYMGIILILSAECARKVRKKLEI